MTRTHWLRPLAVRLTHPRPRPAPHRPAFRPRVEGLEDRTTPTAGALDPSFDGDGKVLTDIGGLGSVDSRGLVASLPDGKVIVVGMSGGYPVAVRYNTDGSLDATYGTAGVGWIVFGNPSFVVYSVAVDSQNRVLVAGLSSQPGAPNDSDFTVARLTATGELDATFDGDGNQTIDFGGTPDAARSVAVDSQDRVLVAGESWQGWGTPDLDIDFAVARLTASGALDAAFDGDGRRTIDFGGHLDFGLGVAVDSQDRVLVAGYSDQGGPTGINVDFAVARLTVSGSLDATFGIDGRRTIDFSGTYDYGYSVAVDSQDRVLVAGQSPQGSPTGYDFTVARLTVGGALDASFDSDGKQTIDFGSIQDIGLGVAVDSHDRALVAGYSNQGSPIDIDFAVARLTATGALDAAFDGDGRRTIDFGGVQDNCLEPVMNSR
jgi:uncharacterized delta-60 repeat protein